MSSPQPATRASRANIRGEHTRARLLEAALESFAARGFHGTSTRDIAEAAGMSPAAVYAHYDTKEALLYRLSIDGHTAVHDLVVQVATSLADPQQRLHDAAKEFASWHARHNTRARVLQYEMAALSAPRLKEVSAIRHQTERCFRQLVRTGVEADVFEVDDAGFSALAILSLGIDVARWYRPGGAWSPDDVGAHCGRIALRIVGSRDG